MILALAVAVAGGIGATARYVVDGLVQDRTSGTFPFGTLVVNVAGSLVLGFVTGLGLDHGLSGTARAVVGVGFCGGLTTWSTATWETVRLAEDGQAARALVNGLGGLVVALAAAAAGLALAAFI